MKKIHIFLIILTISLINNCVVITHENYDDYYIEYSIDGHSDYLDNFNGDLFCSSNLIIDPWYCQWTSFDELESFELSFSGPSDFFEYRLYNYDNSYYTDYSMDGFTIYIDEIDEFDNYISGHFEGLVKSAEYDHKGYLELIFPGTDYIIGDFVLPIETGY